MADTTALRCLCQKGEILYWTSIHIAATTIIMPDTTVSVTYGRYNCYYGWCDCHILWQIQLRWGVCVRKVKYYTGRPSLLVLPNATSKLHHYLTCWGVSVRKVWQYWMSIPLTHCDITPPPLFHLLRCLCQKSVIIRHGNWRKWKPLKVGGARGMAENSFS